MVQKNICVSKYLHILLRKYLLTYLYIEIMPRDVFQAIADPTRREIINLVAKQSLNLNSIAENFDMSRPAISQHIKLLTESGLIVIRQEGRERYCDIQPEKLDEITTWAEQSKKLWIQRLTKLDKLVKDMQKKKSSTTKKNKYGKGK